MSEKKEVLVNSSRHIISRTSNKEGHQLSGPKCGLLVDICYL